MKSIIKNISFSTIASLMVVTFIGITANIPAQASEWSDLFGSSSTQKGKFLTVDEAFNASPSIQGNQLSITFDITEEHYIYRDKLKLKLPDGVTAGKFSFDQQPYNVKDPNFGDTAVFDNTRVTATTTLINTTNTDIIDAPISLKWQGCAKAGLCYPPEKVKLVMNIKKKVC